MRVSIAGIIGILGLCGCATDESVYRQANLECQAVGISEKDPQFATCSAAYSRQHLENQLDRSYRDALKRVPNELDYRIPHQDVY
ncbi:MAG TPA: hypothetical protein VGM72_05215 [Micropepsaceae bacterium]|jgi:hypothetical protein